VVSGFSRTCRGVRLQPDVIEPIHDSGGGHGNFTPERRTTIYVTIREFLTKHTL
jgi:hypothetical protein